MFVDFLSELIPTEYTLHCNLIFQFLVFQSCSYKKVYVSIQFETNLYPHFFIQHKKITVNVGVYALLISVLKLLPFWGIIYFIKLHIFYCSSLQQYSLLNNLNINRYITRVK